MKMLFKIVLFVALFSVLTVSANAHSGDTDSSGGHYDHSSGGYHYHHGYPAHNHYDMDGDGDLDCPYNFNDKTNHGNSSGNSGTSDTSITFLDVVKAILTLIPLSLVTLYLSYIVVGVVGVPIAHFAEKYFKINIEDKMDRILHNSIIVVSIILIVLEFLLLLGIL